MSRVTSGYLDVNKGEVNFNQTCKIDFQKFDSDANFQVKTSIKKVNKVERSQTVRIEQKAGKSIGKIVKKKSSNWFNTPVLEPENKISE